MKLFGYSERGMVDAILYSLYFEGNFNGTRNDLLIGLLGKIKMPRIPETTWSNLLTNSDEFEVYIENTLSEFGNPDIVILCKQSDKYSACIFIEAKVSREKDVIIREFDKFCSQIVERKGLADKGTSSLLFSQLCLKWLMKIKTANGHVSNADMGKLLALNLSKSSQSSKLEIGRKIGSNNIATGLLDKIESIDSNKTYYVALIPDQGKNLHDYYVNEVLPELSSLLNGASVDGWGYFTWKDVEDFCIGSGLTHCKDMFDYNKGHIY